MPLVVQTSPELLIAHLLTQRARSTCFVYKEKPVCINCFSTRLKSCLLPVATVIMDAYVPDY